MMNEKTLTVDMIAAWIRKADGQHNLGTGALAEVIYDNLTKMAVEEYKFMPTTEFVAEMYAYAKTMLDADPEPKSYDEFNRWREDYKKQVLHDAVNRVALLRNPVRFPTYEGIVAAIYGKE